MASHSTPTMEASYEYTSLSHSRATRLIRLYPDANEDAPLGCELEEVSVDKPLPPYVALSYTWNNEEPSVKLKISASAGGDPAVTRILLITPNCAAALKVLRNSDLVRQHGLWIDAICINQACNDEKGDQVAMMATIYDEAKHVLVWLGSEWAPKTYQDVAPFDKRWLRKVCEFHNGLKGMIIQSNTSSRPLTDDLRLVIDKEVLMHMMKAPYWARAWTFQETMNPSTKLLCQDSRHCPVYVLWYGLQQISFSSS
ncbi:HET domain-containing protein [Colletotrichum higginsianum]|uniref:HET domain-containing protein n=1 Tax=Colletotrichum higginsianum (strain IMI 349063) TaxID=759273 RepID=H1V0M0_COLHI|nr:HET domain-containing protein [Colletotrichum higginsianum]